MLQLINDRMLEALLIAAVLLALTSMVLLIVLVRRKPDTLFFKLLDAVSGVARRQERIEDVVRNELARTRQETSHGALLARKELGGVLKNFGDSLLNRISDTARMQKGQLAAFADQLVQMTGLNEKKFDAMRITLERQLRAIQEDNGRQLERMRAVVDEKLQTTLEKRLGESFQQVSERLEQVYRGLGEMRHLATGVGDLKRVLTNVKTRGIWGEIRLRQILEQIFTPDQYEENVAIKPNNGERVEFAIRLPGSDPDRESVVWLPIDAKFPQEDYQRLMDAREAADKAGAERSLKSLEMRIKTEARAIREKYVDPPQTTDFAIMFLPVEGLYAEVLRRPGLQDSLQREYRIVVTGPTTLAALLNSLQMGFRTLAIEKRSSEVWELLGIVKTEFGKFGDVLAKTKKKLQEASNTINQAEVRTRVIGRKLKGVQELPPPGEDPRIVETGQAPAEGDS